MNNENSQSDKIISMHHHLIFKDIYTVAQIFEQVSDQLVIRNKGEHMEDFEYFKFYAIFKF